jgi:putative restriction endonuclease
VQLRLQDIPIEERKATVSETNRYGEEYTVKPRLGQGGFRVEVIEAYHRKCAMTGEKALPVLQASHIKPYAKSGPHDIKNGLLLRADLHILFDQGYLTVTKDHHIEASKEMKEDFDNGEDYLKLHGQNLITLPDNTFDRPSPEFLEWHNENIYLS